MHKKYAIMTVFFLITTGTSYSEEQKSSTPSEESLAVMSEDEFFNKKQSQEPNTHKNNPSEIVENGKSPSKIVDDDDETTTVVLPRRINEIITIGNKFTSLEAILSHIPYKVGEIFNPLKTRQLIHNLYHGLKRFRKITLKGENIGNDLINLHIIVEEKKPLKEVIIEGNKQVTDKEIIKKVNFDDMYAIDAEELKAITLAVKQLYLEKGYMVTVDAELRIDDDDRAIALFTIHEGKKPLIKRIEFIGNKYISSKELRNIIMSKEDWVLSFLDKAGHYHPDRIEQADKQLIEQFYQNKGFLHTKVIDIDTAMNPKTKNITLTFEIEEGDQFRINKVSASGNDILPEEYLLYRLPIRSGNIYSREAIAESIKILELIWGKQGYIFAHIEPSIQPDEDTKTVDISFFSELGEKVFLNKVNIKGNKKTRDKIIRRKLLLEEGELISQNKMDASKHNVESLGYFEPRDGINWKIRRLSNDAADLDLIVKEAKTGHFNAQIGFGGAGANLRSPISGFSVKGDLADTNLFGSGINLNFSASWAKDEQTIVFHIAEPWLFDKPILGALDIYHRRPSYDELMNINLAAVHEKLTGGNLAAGFITQSRWPIFNDTQILMNIGIDDIKYQEQPRASISGANAATNAQYQGILNQEFAPGTFAWVATYCEQDTRNHPIHPSRGHKWRIGSKFAIPSFGNNIGYYKIGLDVNWFTPLINEYDLVLRLHGYFGIAGPFQGKTIPFGELFHIGGPSSVRGFLYGQIGPKFQGDTIGGKKTLFWNAELIFPITPDLSMKGVFFYDGGAGFDNPYLQNVSPQNITGNNFDYRHSIGVGVRLLRPMPIKVDWGFKIDPRKNKKDPSLNETGYEIHFGMTYDW